MNKKSCGFTLIELLVVVLIIGILSAIALPQYQKAVVKSRYATLKALTRAIADAEEVYYLANEEYTNDFDALDVQTPGYNREDVQTNRTYRYFDWGFCNTSSKVDITCRNDLVQMEYIINFRHASNKVTCVALTKDLSAVQNQVCKAETGRSTYSSQGDSYTGWDY